MHLITLGATRKCITVHTNHFSSDLSALADALDSKQAHTSFGKLPLSTEANAKNYSFPIAKREDQEKVYLGELTKLENVGKHTPGPIYF